MILQSLSSASSMNSTARWSNSPELSNPSTASTSTGSTARAKWGEKGVGVGRLWDPDAKDDSEVSARSRDVATPSWASKDSGIGLPGSQSER